MQYQEYGSDKAETIFLLHGGGLSWWNHQGVFSGGLSEKELIRETAAEVKKMLE